jgi:hypothetical protein
MTDRGANRTTQTSQVDVYKSKPMLTFGGAPNRVIRSQ